MPNERQFFLRSKCSLPTHHSGVLHAATSPHACLRSYMVGPRHISSNLLTTFRSLVSRSAFRELGCLDPTTSVPCLVIFVFSGGRIGGVCSRARCLRARKVPRPQLQHGVYCAHSPAFACSCSARGWSGSAIGIKVRSEGPCNEQRRCPKLNWLGGRLCLGGGVGVGVGGGGWGGGR
jgi:hypothetical protein